MATILVVEDTMTEAQFFSTSLQKAGFNITTVTTAEAAKAMLDQKRFDAILLDVVLPGQSGFGLCRDLKKSKQTCDIPVIICSSKSEKIDKAWGIKQGASAYLTKPVDEQELVATIRQFAKG